MNIRFSEATNVYACTYWSGHGHIHPHNLLFDLWLKTLLNTISKKNYSEFNLMLQFIFI